MIYVVCNVETGDLLRISEDPLGAVEAPRAVVALDRAFPDLTRVAWDAAVLDFRPLPRGRRITKLEFVARLGDPAFTALLELSKQSVEIERLIKLIDWATPEADGTSIDLDDLRLGALHALEPTLVGLGKVEAGWASEVLA